MDEKFKQIYYSDDGYWRGKSAMQKLSKASGSLKEEAEKWLLQEPLYQIYCTKYIYQHQNTFLGPMLVCHYLPKPNDIHQADILYLPPDRYEKKVYKYALNIVDVASRYKISYQLTTENSKEVAQAFQ